MTFAAKRENAKLHQAENIPVGPPEDPRFIPSSLYAQKYGLVTKSLAQACRKGKMIGQRRLMQKSQYDRRLAIRWFVLDIEPDDHPGWKEYRERGLREMRKIRRRKYSYKSFSEIAPILLDRFKEGMAERIAEGRGESDFLHKELCKILQVNKADVTYWREIGVPGYGKLPYRMLPDDKKGVIRPDGTYVPTNDKGIGRVDFFYHQKDVVRFLTGQYAEGQKRKFKTISDATAETNLDEIVAEQGYYVYDKKKTYPITKDGFLRWLKNCVQIYDPLVDGGISVEPNEKQHELYDEVFKKDEFGNLKYKLICLSRPRGDYKTTDVCLIVLFFFFNCPRQKIYLIACNSESQAEHLLMGEIKQIIEYSPKLKNNTWLDIQEYEINIKSGKKSVYSFIKTASIKSGTLSNASIFVFTEFYDLRDRQEFAKLEGSTRFRANAFSIAEGIATDENHLFHEFYRAYIEGKDPKMYFQWYGDAWYNPRSTAEEREHFRITHGEAEYTKHFRNIWGGSAVHFATPQQIYEMGVAGIDGRIGPSPELTAAIEEYVNLNKKIMKMEGAAEISNLIAQRHAIRSRFTMMDEIYKLPATAEDIPRLMDVFGFDYYSIGMGLDRAKQMSKRSDRTALVTMLRAPISEYDWLCFVLDIYLPHDSTLDLITQHIVDISNEFGIISGIDIEEYQGRDIYDWLKARGFEATLVPQSFKHKDEIFSLFYTLLQKGMLKSPTVPLWFDEKSKVYHSLPPDGVDDILRAELGAFIEIERIVEGGVTKKVGYYGSKYKMNKTHRVKPGEPNDDIVEAMGHAIHSLREDVFDGCTKETAFATIIHDTNVIGDYPEIGGFVGDFNTRY